MVVSDAGTIDYVGSAETAPPTNGSRLDLRGLVLAPDFLDIHRHGGYGVTFYTTQNRLGAIPQDLARYARWVVGNGVVGFLCSVAAPSAQELRRLVEAFVPVLEAGVPGAEALGLHLEGPFFSAEKKGAFVTEWLRPPSAGELESLLEAGQGWVRQVTLAPELPGAAALAARLRERGVVAAMGHSNADFA